MIALGQNAPLNQTHETGVRVMDEVESLRELRDARGLTLRELADKLPISHSQVHRNEGKDYIKDGDVRDAYAEALGVDRAVIDRICDRGETPRRRVSSNKELLRWTSIASTSRTSPYARMLLLVLPVFMDKDSWIVSVTHQRIAEEAHIPLASIEEHWDEVLASPLLERVGPAEWAFRLSMPQ